MTLAIPQAQIVIAVHDAKRPLRRGIESVLKSRQAGVIVVAHGINPSLLDIPASERVQVLECDWGIGFPGAPFNYGVMQAQAPYVGIMGSDDWYEDGAIDVMIEQARHDHADAVIAPLVYQGRARYLKPRTPRRRNLRAARDNLFSRTAPLGLFKTEVLQNPRYRFNEEVVTGEDIIPSVRLWTDGLKVSHHPDSPGYVITDDATQRVTKTVRPLAETMFPIAQLMEDPDVRDLPRRERQALFTKVLRSHVFDALNYINANGSKDDHLFLSTITKQIITVEPRGPEPLPKAQKEAIMLIAEGKNDQATELLNAFSSLPRRDRVFPDHLRFMLSPGANIRDAILLALHRARSAVSTRQA